MATEHELAAPHMGTAQELNGRQAGSFTDARNAVVPVQPQPSAPDPWAAFNSPGDLATFRQRVAEFNTANQHNVDVMTGYTAASTFNSKGMPQSYGSIADDQAAITVGPTTSTPNGGPPQSGPKSDDPSRTADPHVRDALRAIRTGQTIVRAHDERNAADRPGQGHTPEDP